MTQPARHLHIAAADIAAADTAAAPEAPVDPLVGQLLDGRYRVEGVLGAGGMGLVYRARHHVLGKPLALKVLKPEVSRDEEVMARFRREAQSASAVGSPHICDVSDFGALPDGSTYFVMELLDGPSLTAAMQQDRPMPPARTLRIARQLCDALGAAHARGIVHRDLKPDNVHLVPRGSEPDFVKVLDFGIAKVAGGADKKLTRAGQVFGTPHYMSPEQCAGRDVDQRTDIYALGVMLYEMACGQVPFDADTLMGVLTKHVYEQPIPPHELAAGAQIPPGLEAIILKCLAKQADARYPTMSALAVDLDALERGATPGAVGEHIDRVAPAVQAAPPTRAVAPAAPPGKSSLGRILGVLAALATLAAGAFAIAYFALPGQAPAVEPASAAADDRATVDPIAHDVPEPIADVPEPPPIEATSEQATASEPVMVRLETDPAGAVVYDAAGALIGNTPVTLPRPTGEAPTQYRIAMRGYRDELFAMSAQTQQRVTLHLERERRSHARVDPVPVVRPIETSTTTTTRPATDGQTSGRDLDPLDDGIIDPFEDPPRRRRAR